MKLKQAQEIIQYHIDWINNGKQSEYKYTEESFNKALQIVLKHSEGSYNLANWYDWAF